jgi:hypothetical protein
MELYVTSVDHAPEELYDQVPFVFELVREIPGKDRPDYWIGKCKIPIRWIHENHEKQIKYVVVAARWEGTRIEPNVEHLPIGISYVIDESVLTDETLDFNKCIYVAIGMSHETAGGPPPKRHQGILSGTIGKFFGKGNQ